MRCIFYEKSSGNKSALYIEYSFMNGTFSPKQIRIINNTILFTKDNWETASLALGEISMPDGGAAYGIVAEALVGRLLFGEGLYLTNSNNSITLDGDGIVVSNPNTKKVVFKVTNDGEVNATGGKIGGYTITDTALTSGNVGMSSDQTPDAIAFWAGDKFSVSNNGNLIAKSGNFGVLTINEDGSITSANKHFSVDKDGNLIAAGNGKIGGFEIGEYDLTSIKRDENEKIISAVGMSSDTNAGAIVFWAGGTARNNAPFRVTNKGELYALNANIRGHIDAYGSDNEKNNIYNLCSNRATISTIRTSDMQIAGAVIATWNGTRIDLGSRSKATEEVTATVTIVTENIFREYIRIELTAPLTRDMTFIVVYQSASGASTPQYSAREITIKKDSGTIYDDTDRAGAYYIKDKVWFNSANGSNEYTFYQETNNGNTTPAISFTGDLMPDPKYKGRIGGDTNRWHEISCNMIYAKDSQINTSDIKEKMDIARLPEVYEAVFDALEPVTYKFTENDSGRTHTGLIAQQIKAALDKYGIDTKDFAAYCEWKKTDGQIGCGLRYVELIPLCISEIQRLKKRIAKLETQI